MCTPSFLAPSKLLLRVLIHFSICYFEEYAIVVHVLICIFLITHEVGHPVFAIFCVCDFSVSFANFLFSYLSYSFVGSFFLCILYTNYCLMREAEQIWELELVSS